MENHLIGRNIKMLYIVQQAKILKQNENPILFCFCLSKKRFDICLYACHLGEDSGLVSLFSGSLKLT